MNKILQIELTNNCTGKCEWCNYQKMTRQKGFIELSLIKKIAKKIFGRQSFVYLHFFGESAFHPKICEIVKILKDYQIDSGIYVNSRNLTKGVLRNLKEANLKEIHITVDKLADFDIIELFAKRLNLQTKLFLVKIDLPERFENRLLNLKFYKFVNSIKDTKEFVEARIAKFEDSEINDGKYDCCRKENGICDLRKDNQYIVLWDGRITTCLKDYNGEMCIGTIDDLDNFNNKKIKCL